MALTHLVAMDEKLHLFMIIPKFELAYKKVCAQEAST